MTLQSRRVRRPCRLGRPVPPLFRLCSGVGQRYVERNLLLLSFTVSRLLFGRLVMVCPERALEQALEQTMAIAYIK